MEEEQRREKDKLREKKETHGNIFKSKKITEGNTTKRTVSVDRIDSVGSRGSVGKGNSVGRSNSTEESVKRGLSEEESDEEEFDIKDSSPAESSLTKEDLIDKGEEADTESDESTSKAERSKKSKKRKSKKKKSKMDQMDLFLSSDTRKRSKTQPNKRKKIRKILTENKLQEETLQALRDEEERQKRLGLFTNEDREPDERTDEPFKFLEEDNISGFPELACDFNFEEYDSISAPNLEILSATPVDEIERILSPKETVPVTSLEGLPMATPMLHQSESTGSLSKEVLRFEQLLHQNPPLTLAPTCDENTAPTNGDDFSNYQQTPILPNGTMLTSREHYLQSNQGMHTIDPAAPPIDSTIASTAPLHQFTQQNFLLASSGQPILPQISQVAPTLQQQGFKLPHTKPALKADVICISSESSGDESKKKTVMTSSKPRTAETINISSASDSSDDVIFTGTNDHEVVEGDPDVNNSGMHVNDAMNQPDHLGRVLVNKNRPPDEPEIFLSNRPAKAVKPHQIGGIRFMFDNIVESLEHYKRSSGFGCILAHSMGLGKTLQVISFIDVFLKYTGAKTALVVVPVNTLLNWVAEFEMWLPATKDNANEIDDMGETAKKSQGRQFKVRLLCETHKTTEVRAQVISSWKQEGGVLLMGYEMFRLLTNQKLRRSRKRKTKNTPPGDSIETIDLDEEDRISELTAQVFENLVKPGPDLIVCDEGHRIKNSHASISKALKQVATRRRIVLTGYPLQNNLMEYWCMVDFVRPNFLGTRQEFSNMFERPISNGQCADSNESDIRLMRFRSHVLHSLLKGFVQRRSHVVLRDSLPLKEEYVLMIRFSPWQKKLYNGFIKLHKENSSGSWCSALNPIKAFSICCKIWNHPDVLYRTVCRKIEEIQQNNESLLDADLDLPETVLDGVIVKRRSKKRESNSENGKLLQSVGLNPFGNDEKDKGINYEWARELLHDYPADTLELSGKMVILMQIIHHSVSTGDKILVFSQSLTTLTLIEEFLSRMKVPNSSEGLQVDRNWCKNESYFRLDGNTNTALREKMIQQFNSKDNNTVHLFLLSTRAGCLGINLIGANRVVVFDISWNPCHDAQAVCRVYRYGQTKKCIIYRLICDQSMEKKIYDRQISKQGMADRVVDELNPIQSLQRQDITKLLIYSDEELPVPDLTALESQDKTLLSVCQSNGHWFTKNPFFHESLLMDCKGTRLTKAEKRAAEKGYEQEKLASSSCNYSRPSYANFYAAAGYPEKTNSRSKGSIFTKSSSISANDRPVANVRPVQSTPYPMQSLGTQNGDLQVIGHLQRAGINVKKTIATSDIPLPQSASGPSSKPLVSAGEAFYMIQGVKGMYIGTISGRIFALRSQKVEQEEAPSPPIRTPGGQMITSREQESQVIKTAFNSMIRRNPAMRQPMRYPHMPLQPIRTQQNYNAAQLRSELTNFMKGQSTNMSQNEMLNQQNPLLTQQRSVLNQQDSGLTQQSSVLNQQSSMLTQQDSGLTQQDSGLTQQMSMLTQQIPMLTEQNSEMTQQNAGINMQDLGMIQQNSGMNAQNSAISQHNSGQNLMQTHQNGDDQHDLMTPQSFLMNQQNLLLGNQNFGIPANQSFPMMTPQNSTLNAMSQQIVPMETDSLLMQKNSMQNLAMSSSSNDLSRQLNSVLGLNSMTQQNFPGMSLLSGYGEAQNSDLVTQNGVDQQISNLTQQISNTTEQNRVASQQSPHMTQQELLTNFNQPNGATTRQIPNIPSMAQQQLFENQKSIHPLLSSLVTDQSATSSVPAINMTQQNGATPQQLLLTGQIPNMTAQNPIPSMTQQQFFENPKSMHPLLSSLVTDQSATNSVPPVNPLQMGNSYLPLQVPPPGYAPVTTSSIFNL